MRRVAIFPLARNTFDVSFAGTLANAATDLVEASGTDMIGSTELILDDAQLGRALDEVASQGPPDLVLVLQTTFTDAGSALRIAERFGDRPLAIWAFPEPREGGRLRLNAFCGLNLAAHALARMDRSFGALYADPNEVSREVIEDLLNGRLVPARPPTGPAEVDAISPRAARAVEAIRGGRIGRIGEHPPGFATCEYDGRNLDALARVTVEPIALDEVFSAARSAPDDRVAAVRATAGADCGTLDNVDADELDRSLRLACALEGMRGAGRFDAFAVRCWPECFTEYGGAMCAPVAMMGERRVPCACEADVYGALTSLLMQALADEPAFLVDLVDLDRSDDTGVVWHCGQAPISMSAGRGNGDGASHAKARATVHTNRRMALLYEFALKPGRVTLARISQAGGAHSLVIMGGEMLARPAPFTGTCGTIRFDRPAGAMQDAILGYGLEHHTTLAYGDHRLALREVAAELALPVVVL